MHAIDPQRVLAEYLHRPIPGPRRMLQSPEHPAYAQRKNSHQDLIPKIDIANPGKNVLDNDQQYPCTNKFEHQNFFNFIFLTDEPSQRNKRGRLANSEQSLVFDIHEKYFINMGL